MKIQRVVFYVSRRTGAPQIAQECAQLLSRAGAALCAPQAYSRPVTLAPQVELVPDGQAAAGADLALVIGGDGTILRATYDAAPLGIPILGINMGRLGFLSELEPDEIHLLENVLSGDYSIEPRMMLAASVEREGQTLFQAHALNDVCINRAPDRKILSLDILSDRQSIARFRADGVIISTPTGSTAYSMSAGGPIIEPTLQNMTITPICAHGLYAKSFVLAPQRRIRLELVDSRGAMLIPDGRTGFSLNSHDSINICQSPYTARLVRIKGKSVYEVIRDKLNYDYT